MKDDLKLQRIQELSQKILDKTISDKELIEYDQWYNSYDDHIVTAISEADLRILGDKLFKRIEKQRKNTNKYIKLVKSIANCAAVLLLVCLSYWAYVSLDAVNIIEPGHNQAFVRDSEGTEHNFNDLKVGDRQEIGDLFLTKQEDGTIHFAENKKSLSNDKISEIVTPKGGEYKIYLPDGTLVWMNADTKLEFKTAFTRHERYVRVQGEAYFEVKHWLGKPFVVETPSEKIRVLGTKFNVSAYSRNQSATSLTEGSVQISSIDNKGQHIILKPGQQARHSNHQMVVQNFDREAVLAWKNGEFMFDQVRLEDVLTAFSRWYDVEFEFEDPALKDIPFWGTFSKHEQLEEHLSNLQYTKIAKFKIKGRRIIVTK